jgi:hypothetical protein
MTRALLLLCLALPCAAYYHFVHYATRLAPWIQSPEKYDLNALPNKTLRFYVTEQGPDAFAAGDTYPALLSQLRAAVGEWNRIETSELRVEFGGMTQQSVLQSGPRIDVLFGDLPPGIKAMAGPTERGEFISNADGRFLPILRSVMVLPRDLSQMPSWRDDTYMTLAHEFGHTLGLQHSFTGALMSTEPNRNTTRGKAISSDDIAGLSILYPSRNFLALTGSISGRVAINGIGQNLASVVALSPTGSHTVGTLTNPDGSFRIQGLVPGQYVVYAQPLPAILNGEVTPGNIVYPLGPDRQPIQPGVLFNAAFFPGVTDVAQASALSVVAGRNTENINLNLQQRTTQRVHSASTFSFPAQVATRPAFVNPASTRNFFLLTWNNGDLNAGSVSTSTRASVVTGTPTTSAARVYSANYLRFDLTAGNGEGERHIVVQSGDEMIVLPEALRLVNSPPPAIAAPTAVTIDGVRYLALSGSNLRPDSIVLFDGLPARTRIWDDANSRLLVVPPAMAPGQRAVLEIVNADLQTSQFAQGNTTVSWTSDAIETPSFNLSPATLPAGSESVLEVSGAGLNFASGQVHVGFASNDVQVRRIVVLGPNRALVHVAIAANAAQQAMNVTLHSGLQHLSLPAAFGVAAPVAGNLALSGQPMNAASGLPRLTPGSPAVWTVLGLPTNVPLILTLNGTAVPATASTLDGRSVMSFTVPANATPGPLVVRLQVGSLLLAPAVILLDPPPPVIASVASPLQGTATAEANRVFSRGETITLTVAGLDESEPFIRANRLVVLINDVEHYVLKVHSLNNGSHQFEVQLLPTVPAGAATLILNYNGRLSEALPLTVR